MPEIPSGSVIITPDDMWRAIETIKDTGTRTEQAVSRLELTLNPALNTIRGELQALDEREANHHTAHGKRITDLEKQSWSTRWVPAVVTGLLGGGGGVVLSIIITRSI